MILLGIVDPLLQSTQSWAKNIMKIDLENLALVSAVQVGFFAPDYQPISTTLGYLVDGTNQVTLANNTAKKRC